MRRSAKKESLRRSLSVEEATVVLDPYFLASRDLFVSFCNKLRLGNKIKNTRLECRSDVHDTDRHFAGATTDGKLIVCATEMPDLPEDTVAAILAHEFGHIVDHLYPGRFIVDEEELEFLVEDEDDPRIDQVRVARIKQWQARDYHTVEITADLIAEAATGCRIGYSGKCMLQGLNRGVPRPIGLR